MLISPIFAAGGGAGDNIELGDVVKYESNKYTTLKDDFSTTSNVTQFNTLKLHFNKANTILNKDQTSAQGSSILYDFFDPTRKPIPYKVFGGAGGGLGKGTGINPITFIDDAQILKASNNYNLTSIVEFGKNQYPNPKG